MSGHHLITRAVLPVIDMVGNIKPDQLDAPTPCTEFDVRRVIHHLLFWGPSLEGAAHKRLVPPPAQAEPDVDLTGGDWAAELVAQLERAAEAWSAPQAWQGVTRMGGPTELPAATIGGMVLTEVVVHGWDLGQATGQAPHWDDDVHAFVHREVEATAEMGRGMGIYGPEVPVPADAPLLHRTLGLTGRHPS